MVGQGGGAPGARATEPRCWCGERPARRFSDDYLCCDACGTLVLQHPPDADALRVKDDATDFYERENAMRRELGYPPYGRLANVLVWGRERRTVADVARAVSTALVGALPVGSTVMGPSPCPLERLKGVWRWHVLVKAPRGAPLGSLIGQGIADVARPRGVSLAVDVDAVDLL